MEFSSYRDSVAVYLRKSRMDPDSESIEETLARHEDTLMKLAKKLNLTVTAVYKEVVSGDGLFTRPQMVKLLEDIEKEKYSAVMCMEIDRLGRSSQKDGGIILETMQEHGVFIITPAKTYDLNDEIDEQSVEMQSFIARQELKSIKRRLRRGVEKTVGSGFHVAEPPYGYRRAYINKRPTLEINNNEADVVRMIFDMYVNRGMGSQSIADTLNKMGHSPRKSCRFSRNTVRFFLANPVYTGKIVWNRQSRVKKKQPSDKNRCVANPSEKWIVADGAHEAIISDELFAAAEKIRRSRSHPPHTASGLKNPFAGLIACANCGAPMQRQASSERLVCMKKGCIKSAPLDEIEAGLWKVAADIMREFGGKITLRADSGKEQSEKLLKTALLSARRSAATLAGQKSRLMDLLETGVYDIKMYTERAALIDSRIDDVRTEIEKTENELTRLREISDITEAIGINELIEGYSFLTPAEKNKLYKTITDSVVYSNEGGKITLTVKFNI